MFYLSFPIYYLRAKAGSNFAALIAGMIPPNNAVIIDVKTAIIVAVYGYSGMDIGVSIGKKIPTLSTSTTEIKTAIMQTSIESINCDPKTNTAIFILEAPNALLVKSSCVLCSRDDNPILICPKTETKSNNVAVTISPNCSISITEL